MHTCYIPLECVRAEYQGVASARHVTTARHYTADSAPLAPPTILTWDRAGLGARTDIVT